MVRRLLEDESFERLAHKRLPHSRDVTEYVSLFVQEFGQAGQVIRVDEIHVSFMQDPPNGLDIWGRPKTKAFASSVTLGDNFIQFLPFRCRYFTSTAPLKVRSPTVTDEWNKSRIRWRFQIGKPSIDKHIACRLLGD